MPIQSDKMVHMLSWKDIKEPTDYIYEKYVKNKGRRMYLYGVSLGATIQTHYMVNDNENTPYSAMVSYANVFAPADTVPHFKKTMWGIYDYGLGFSLNKKIRDALP